MKPSPKGKNNSAEGAEDSSQGQARSAPPLEAVCVESSAAREGRDDDLPTPSDQCLSPLRGSGPFFPPPGAARFALPPQRGSPAGDPGLAPGYFLSPSTMAH